VGADALGDLDAFRTELRHRQRHAPIALLDDEVERGERHALLTGRYLLTKAAIASLIAGS
jgi:hypothetical protein